MITVRLHATFRIATPAGMQDRLELELPEGSTVSSLLKELELEHDPDHMLLAVNRRMVEETAPLQDGDEVRVMPALSGGACSIHAAAAQTDARPAAGCGPRGHPALAGSGAASQPFETFSGGQKAGETCAS